MQPKGTNPEPTRDGDNNEDDVTRLSGHRCTMRPFSTTR